jgi:hypothetical protein
VQHRIREIMTHWTLTDFRFRLAMEFVASLDEELSSASYYDPDGRYLSAGIVELLFRDVLDLDALRSWKAFCTKFDVPKQEYIEAFDGKPKCIFSRKQAKIDNCDPSYLDKDTRYRRQAGEIAIQCKNDGAVWQFVETTTSFGVVDSLLVSLGIKRTGIFQRYQDYCCWSRWERILFLPQCPTTPEDRCQSKLLASNCFDMSEGSTTRTSSRELTMIQKLYSPIRSCFGWDDQKKFLNFEGDEEQTLIKRFIKDIIGILLLGNMYKSLHAAFKTRNYIEVPFRFVDGVIEWFNYTIQVTFPLTLIGFYFLVFHCY